MGLTGQNGDLLSTPKGGSAGHEGDRLAHKSTTLPQLASGVHKLLELCRGNAIPEKAQKTSYRSMCQEAQAGNRSSSLSFALFSCSMLTGWGRRRRTHRRKEDRARPQWGRLAWVGHTFSPRLPLVESQEPAAGTTTQATA